MSLPLIMIATFRGRLRAGRSRVVSLFADFGNTDIEDRLQVLTGKKTADQINSVTKEALLQEGMTGLAGLSHKVMAKFSNLKLLFAQADSPITPPTFFLISAGCGAVGVVVAMIAHSPMPLYPVAGLMFSAFAAGLAVVSPPVAGSRSSPQQLPDALELIARALRSGHSLASGLHVVVEEMPDPISAEFGMCYEEQNLGVPIEQALKSMHKRMPNIDFKFFATAVAIQRQSGGDLAEILDKIGHIVRERFKILGQVQALTGEGRITGVVLMALADRAVLRRLLPQPGLCDAAVHRRTGPQNDRRRRRAADPGSRSASRKLLRSKCEEN